MTETSLITFSRRGFVLVSAGSLLSACVTMPTNKGVPSGTKDETAAALPMVNELRRSKGLSSLSVNSAASTAAAYQADRMVKAQKMAHLIGLTDSFLIRMKDGKVPLPAAKTSQAVRIALNASSRPGSPLPTISRTCWGHITDLAWPSLTMPQTETAPIGRWYSAPEPISRAYGRPNGRPCCRADRGCCPRARAPQSWTVP